MRTESGNHIGRLLERLRRAKARRGAQSVTLWVLGVCMLLSLFRVIPGAVLALGVTVMVLREFYLRIDRGLALAEAAAMLACLQWLVGPFWYYQGKFDVAEMGMAVIEAEYFSLAVPGTAAFCLGLLLFGKTVDNRHLLAPVKRGTFFQIGLILNGIAFVGDVAGRLGPESLAFAFFLVAQLRYVGILYLWFTGKPLARWLAGICVLPLFMSSAESAMFHDMLLWGGLLFSFWLASRPRSMATKALILVAAALAAFTIQGTKESYRSKVWNAEDASYTDELVQFWSNFSELDQQAVVENAMTRLNQGWIVSHVMSHVPVIEPYAAGETIKDAMVAAAVPRFLYGEKAKAGGQENFKRFTGLPINETTSMNISLLGEGYANFGLFGGCAFLFVTGIGMSYAIGRCFKFAVSKPTFLFWIPLIFYQAIKAETDFNEILNQIVKGGLMAFACYWMVERYWPTKSRRLRRAHRGRSRDQEASGDAEAALPVPATAE